MINHSKAASNIPLEQQAIRASCMHPTGTFIEFKKEEIEQSIPAIFEKRVVNFADRIAVKTKHKQFTYNELNQAANRLGWAIVDHFGEDNETVAILLEHSTMTIVAALGVLKAGKTLVTLDPSLPLERMGYILEDSQAIGIVTNNKSLGLAIRVARDQRCSVINLDTIDKSLSIENLGLLLSPETYSQILYTSGATGQPKGVLRNHRNSLHAVMVKTNAARICSDDRYLLFRTLTGGFGVELLTGASLFPYDIKLEGFTHLADWLIREEITIFYSTPSTFRHFANTLNSKQNFPHLRLIQLSGEPVSNRDIELYKKHFAPTCIMLVSLASTEAWNICMHFINKETQLTHQIVPVGYPVDDKEVMLLDESMKQIGFNEVGEIAVKSRYLALGYWRNSDLTRTKFLPDPHGREERIYLTGDLGRISEHGCLEYLGRKDSQVKIRGFKVDISEAEAALVDHSGIKEATLIARENQSGDTELIAYFVPSIRPAPTVSALRNFLKAKLADYMIPSAFVVLDKLPMTATGKVDRRALPEAVNSRPDLDAMYVLPRTPIEQEMAKIWAEVLSLDRVGLHDNFLDLGGNSLLATQIVSRVLDAFQVEMSLLSLLESPTIADMAAVITENQSKGGLEDLEDMMSALESLTDQEAERLLARERGENKE